MSLNTQTNVNGWIYTLCAEMPALHKYIPATRNKNPQRSDGETTWERSEAALCFRLPGIGVAGDIGKKGFLNNEGELTEQRRHTYLQLTSFQKQNTLLCEACCVLSVHVPAARASVAIF